MIPDWQLPRGVDRGLWDYLHSEEMVANYDAQMAVSALAQTDLAFCEKHFPTPGRLIDLGCGTGRLCEHFAARGFSCVGVDLSEAMLQQARTRPSGNRVQWIRANLMELTGKVEAHFDYAACLFSTWGMVRGAEHRAKVLQQVDEVLRPGGRFVLHVHNRGYYGLGFQTLFRGDLTRPQAYGGAPLTLHHFRRSEVLTQLDRAGFAILEVEPVGPTQVGRLSYPWFLTRWRAYGYLILAEKPG
jgi:SAM-dependent methyltransferase